MSHTPKQSGPTSERAQPLWRKEDAATTEKTAYPIGELLGLESDSTINHTVFSGSFPVADTTALVQDPADITKLVRIDAGAVGTGTTKAIIMPNADAVIPASGLIVGTTDTQTLSAKTLASPTIDGTVSGTAFLDEDSLGSDSPTKLASQQSIKTYVDTAIAAAVTAEDLDFTGDSGTGAVDLDSQVLTIAGTANQITTVASNQSLTVSIPSTYLNSLPTETSIASGDFIAMVDITDSDSGKITFANFEATLSLATSQVSDLLSDAHTWAAAQQFDAGILLTDTDTGFSTGGGLLLYDVAIAKTHIFRVDNTNSLAIGASGFAFNQAAGSAGIRWPTNNQLDFSIGVADQFHLVNGAIRPTTTNDIDLGSSSLEFKEGFFADLVHAASFVADTDDGGTASTTTWVHGFTAEPGFGSAGAVGIPPAGAVFAGWKHVREGTALNYIPVWAVP